MLSSCRTPPAGSDQEDDHARAEAVRQPGALRTPQAVRGLTARTGICRSSGSRAASTSAAARPWGEHLGAHGPTEGHDDHVKDVTFLEALPRNPSGKVLKRDLRATTHQ
jgi:acyl-CoA synthetase (AMP-forming)/AMP-acid ligase II